MFQLNSRLALMNQLSLIVMVLISCLCSPVFAQEGKSEQKAKAEESTLLDQGLQPDGRIMIQSNHTETEEKIYEALDEVVLFEFPGNPLSDIVDYLSEAHNIPFLIDEIALEELGIASDHEVKLVIKMLSLADSLSLLLEPHGLTYVVRNGALVVTTIDVAEALIETRVYNVRALNIADPEALADVLIYTTGEESWSQFHGPGNLSFFNGSFIIKQNQRTHQEIEAVLNQLLNDVQNSSESPQWSAKDRSNEPKTPVMQGGGFGGGTGTF